MEHIILPVLLLLLLLLLLLVMLLLVLLVLLVLLLLWLLLWLLMLVLWLGGLVLLLVHVVATGRDGNGIQICKLKGRPTTVNKLLLPLMLRCRSPVYAQPLEARAELAHLTKAQGRCGL